MGSWFDGGRVRGLVACLTALAAVAGVLTVAATPSAAIVPPPSTTTPRRTTTTSEATTTTVVPAPTTTVAPSPTTTVAPSPTTPPPPPTSPPSSGQPPAPPPAPPPPAESDDEPELQQVEPPCADDAFDDYYTVATGETLTIPHEAGLFQNDLPCGGSYTIEIVTNPHDGTVAEGFDGSGSFVYTPDPGFDGEDNFTYALFESNVEVDQASVTIWVIDDCTVVAVADGYTTPHETALTVPAHGFLDNDTLDCGGFGPDQFLISDGPSHGTLVDQGVGAFDYQPDPGFSGVDKFKYVIYDGSQSLLLAMGTVSIYVEGPVCAAVDDVYSTAVDVPLAVPAPGVLGNDTLCNQYDHVVFLGQPSHGLVVQGVGGGFEYTPEAGYVGPDSFTYELRDFLAVPLATATVHIDVGPPPPTTTTTTTTTLVPPPDTTTTTNPPESTVTAVGTSPPPGTVSEPAPTESTAEPSVLRIATFNASLDRTAEGQLVADLTTSDDPQAAAVAEIIQRTRPDIVLINEFDYVDNYEAVDLFRANYLEVSQNGADPIEYPYAYTAPVNTGVQTGFDLNNDGTVGGPDDAFGFGEFPGQYGMVVLSRYPIVEDEVRTFQNLLWASMPQARLPDDPATPEPDDWYSAEELAVLRLSSKSHWDVPIDVDGRIVHVLASHPTPPVFDGAEAHNGLRNADEIAFWADYVGGGDTSWIVDDAGTSGGLVADAEFVIAGDMNADPVDGDSVEGAIQQLLGLDMVQDPFPISEGAAEASQIQGQANEQQAGNPATDTADFGDDPEQFGPGNLRVDFVLPSEGVEIVAAGVFWPPASDPLSSLVVTEPFTSSDHRLVWVDVR